MNRLKSGSSYNKVSALNKLQQAVVLPNEASARHFSKALAKAWQQVIGEVKGGFRFFLIGPLGSGKSFCVREFLKSCGWLGAVNSPSFSLREDYKLTSSHVVHLDLYRLKSPYELIELGIDELFNEPSTVFVEWPTLMAKWLPAPDITLEFKYLEGKGSDLGRVLTISGFTDKGDRLLKLCLNYFAQR